MHIRRDADYILQGHHSASRAAREADGRVEARLSRRRHVLPVGDTRSLEIRDPEAGVPRDELFRALRDREYEDVQAV